VLVAWYLPTLDFSLWPFAALLAFFVPVSIWHELSWRQRVAEYARLRRKAGAEPGEWPSRELRILLAAQPWLLLSAAGLLLAGVAFAVFTLLLWPRTPAGFDLPINYFDLPYLWTMVVAGVAACVAAIAIALDAAHSPWARVADRVRRATHSSEERRRVLFAEALAADPELQLRGRDSDVSPQL